MRGFQSIFKSGFQFILSRQHVPRAAQALDFLAGRVEFFNVRTKNASFPNYKL
jgi:hypothetical protein